MKIPKLIIIVPCYNEEAVLPNTIARLCEILDELIKKQKITDDSSVLFVNDGSHDRTWEIIKAAFCENPRISGLSLSGNFGHQNALLAGIYTVCELCDVTVSIDADLQDDENAIELMIDKYITGCDIVYGVRNDRKSDTFFKRSTASIFYKAMSFFGAKTIDNHADFRLLSKRCMKALSEYPERNLFLRGIVPLLGFSSDTVSYTRKKRTAGKTKYPLSKMLSFALNGITSFSIKPIKLVTMSGFFIILCSIAAFIYTICSYIFGRVIPGWSSLMISIWFLGGVQLFSIGLVGEYVGKTYIETKQRPLYHIDEFLTHDSEQI